MASIVSAGTTSGTALNMSGDTSGVLQLASNNGTTAVTIDTSQNVTLTGGGQIRSNATNTPVTFADSAGTQVGTLCRAWVNFTSTTIRASFNVSSITQRATGDYTVNFTNALPDKNYAVAGMVSDDALANRGFNIQNTYTVGMNASYCYVTVFAASTPTAVTVSFFR